MAAVSAAKNGAAHNGDESTGTGHSIKVGDKLVPVTGAPGIDLEAVTSYKPFQDWVESMSKESGLHQFSASSVHIQSVDWFPNGKIGFVKFKADVFLGDKRVPGIVFMRGGAVAFSQGVSREQKKNKEM